MRSLLLSLPLSLLLVTEVQAQFGGPLARMRARRAATVQAYVVPQRYYYVPQQYYVSQQQQCTSISSTQWQMPLVPTTYLKESDYKLWEDEPRLVAMNL